MKTFRDSDDLRYKRFGYISREEKSDNLLKLCLDRLPGDGTLPLYWKHHSIESFQTRFNGLGSLLWAKSASSHLLLLNGVHLFRIWTDAKHCLLVDIPEHVADRCSQDGFLKKEVPKKSIRKSAPLTHRITIDTEERLHTFVDIVISVFGIQQWETK